MLNRFEQFNFVISGINRCIQKLERDEMVKYGYKGAFAQYLMVLKHYPEGVTLTELCEKCDKDKAAVSRIVAEMENKGLVYKENKEAQVYKAKIYLTEKGNETARFVAKRVKDALSVVGDKIMTEDERRLFYGVLGDILEKLEVMAKEGIPKKGE